MCFHPMQVEAVAPSGVLKAFVPCTRCEECRSVERHAWSFRLQAELQYRASLGWHTGFVTLTYDPAYLPVMDHDLFDEPNPVDVPCFDRERVRSFVKSIRKYLHRHYRVTELVYMVCSEYGKRGRPHYHMLLCWPPAKCVDKVDLGNAPYLDDVTMHRLVRDCWHEGYIFPQYPQGGFDGHYYHKPFEVINTTSFAAKYASKYCCKDINFSRELGHHVMLEPSAMTDELSLKLRNSKPFHIQSRSLGWSLIRNMSNEQKLKILETGYSFDGTLTFEHVPLYIRNKLFFSPSYIVDSDGKRLVRRERTDFFFENRERIFEKKVDFYEDLLDRCSKLDFWSARGIDTEHAMYFSGNVRQKIMQSGYSCRELSEQYCAWFGVFPTMCYDVKPVDQWFSRFSDYWRYVDPSTGELCHDDGLSVGNDFDFDGESLLDRERVQQINDFWNFIFDTLVFTNNWMKYNDDLHDVEDYHRQYLDNQEEYRVYQTVDRHLAVS